MLENKINPDLSGKFQFETFPKVLEVQTLSSKKFNYIIAFYGKNS